MSQRTGQSERATLETRMSARVDLDGSGTAQIAIGVPFLEHMLEQVARHGLIDIRLEGEGDLPVDAHHTVEDAGICLGQALAEAVGGKQGIQRFGTAYCPLDEALSRVVVDLSGRPGLQFHVTFPRAHIGDFDVDLVEEFFRGLVNHAWMTVHVDGIRGSNAHHVAETVFKAFGRALSQACTPDPRLEGAMPSTKGSL